MVSAAVLAHLHGALPRRSGQRGGGAALGARLSVPQSAAAFRHQVEAIAAFDGSADLGRLAAPALVIAGAEDVLFRAGDVAAFAARLPDARFVALEGAAHAVHTEQPRSFVDTVAAFLDA